MTKTFDRLSLLATFARIAERGSISAAARDLGMAQASASRQLAELEGQLGAQLVARTTHSLALTEAGEAALTEARALLGSWDALADRFRDEDGPLTGPLKAVAPVAIGQLYLSRALLAFQTEHPGVAITWLLTDAPIRFSEIGCDLWINVGRPQDDTLIVKDVADVERIVVAAPAVVGGLACTEPRAVSHIAATALDPFYGDRISLTGPDGSRFTVGLQVTMSTNNIFCARESALMGAGLAVLPRSFVAEDLAAGRLMDVLPGWRAPSLTLTTAIKPASRSTRRLRALKSHMEAAIVAIPGVRPSGSRA